MLWAALGLALVAGAWGLFKCTEMIILPPVLPSLNTPDLFGLAYESVRFEGEG